jgi:hypothetical protein
MIARRIRSWPVNKDSGLEHRMTPGGLSVRALIVLWLVTVPLRAQGVTVENGIRFPNGTVQMRSPEPAPLTVVESGLKSCFDISGVEVPCAGSGHDGDARPGMEWRAEGRFSVVEGDGIVVDELTGLQWLMDAGCIVGDWEDALTSIAMLNAGTDFGCTDYTPGSYSNWRMPNILELATLIDYGSSDALPAGHPFVNAGVGNCATWSSTTQLDPDGQNNRAWGIPLSVPGHPSPHLVQGQLKGNPNNCLWPVRNQDVPGVPISTTLQLDDGGVTFGDGSRPMRAPSHGVLLTRQTGQTTCFSEQGIEIVCAGSGHDGDLRTGIAWPEPRFVDNGDGTVEDALTGRIWLEDPECLGDFITWQNALGLVTDLNAGTDFGCGGYTPGSFDDWRLPTIPELISIFDFGSDTGLTADPPFDLSGPNFCLSFWSSTSDIVSPDQAWRLFIGPDATFLDVQPAPKNWTQCVWPVRE